MMHFCEFLQSKSGVDKIIQYAPAERSQNNTLTGTVYRPSLPITPYVLLSQNCAIQLSHTTVYFIVLSNYKATKIKDFPLNNLGELLEINSTFTLTAAHFFQV